MIELEAARYERDEAIIDRNRYLRERDAALAALRLCVIAIKLGLDNCYGSEERQSHALAVARAVLGKDVTT